VEIVLAVEEKSPNSDGTFSEEKGTTQSQELARYSRCQRDDEKTYLMLQPNSSELAIGSGDGLFFGGRFQIVEADFEMAAEHPFHVQKNGQELQEITISGLHCPGDGGAVAGGFRRGWYCEPRKACGSRPGPERDAQEPIR